MLRLQNERSMRDRTAPDIYSYSRADAIADGDPSIDVLHACQRRELSIPGDHRRWVRLSASPCRKVARGR